MLQVTNIDRSAVDAFETFRSYLEKEVAPLLPLAQREHALDGIVRAAYAFGGALLRRGAVGAGDWLAFQRHSGTPGDQAGYEEPMLAPRQPDNIIGFPSPGLSPEERP
jgi:hypothetical protein